MADKSANYNVVAQFIGRETKVMVMLLNKKKTWIPALRLRSGHAFTGMTKVILIMTIIGAINSRAVFASSLELKGTIFTKSLEAIAIIKDIKTDRINMCKVGDIIDGSKILHIKRGEIVLGSDRTKYILSLPGGNVIQPKALDLEIAKKDEVFHISKVEINKALLNAPQIMRDVKIMPHFAKGRPQGVRLSKIKEGSVFEKAGVKSGDVVKSINGMTLNTPYQIFKAYKELKNEKDINVEVIRDNKSVALSYIIE